ncbi:magnesium transporter [Candidatus Nitrospira bockiana]
MTDAGLDTGSYETRRTAADLMISAIPCMSPDATVAQALAVIGRDHPDEAGHVYLVDEGRELLGQVPIERILTAPSEAILAGLRGPHPLRVSPGVSAETAALLAVERHESDVTVVDARGRLLGAIPIGRLLAVLHEEHVDDLLRKGGVGPLHPTPTEPHSAFDAYRARLPWLVIGLFGGWIAAAIAGRFAVAFEREIALAFFLPLVVYMADAVGTQTETVLVRALAYGPVPPATQLVRESLLGLLIGVTLGAVAAGGLLVWDGRARLAAIVGLTLISTAVAATCIASLLPLALSRIGADPALASGPVATVIQDVLSVTIYLVIATALM